MKNSRRCKFTVIELLTVIAVFCIALTMLLPAVTSGTQRAKLTACAGNLRNIGQGVIFYSCDNSDLIPNIMPGLENASIPVLRLPGNNVLALGRLINGYLPHAGVFGCPGSPGYEEQIVAQNWQQNVMQMTWSAFLYRGGCADFQPELFDPANHNKAYIMDFACITNQGQQFAPHDYRQSNLLYTDCHVENRRNSAEPFKLYTVQAARHGEITPDCSAIWQRADR